MKHSIYISFLLASVPAFGATTFYYETTGQCSGTNGLFLNPNATSCSQAITHITPPTQTGKTFGGYWAGNTQVIDANGNLLVGNDYAGNLFGAGETNKNAYGWFAPTSGNGEVMVAKATIWPGHSGSSAWYFCSGVQNQVCTVGGTFVSPYAPNCWSSPSGPDNAGYDYAFNSWHTAAPNGSDYQYISPTTSNWCNHIVDNCPSGDNGDVRIDGGCNITILDYQNQGSKFFQSNGKVYPFACKKLRRSATENWETEIITSDGRTVKLNNDIPGKCEYTTTCPSGATCTENGVPATHCTWSCEGEDCYAYRNSDFALSCTYYSPGGGDDDIDVYLDLRGGLLSGGTHRTVKNGSVLNATPDRSTFDGAIFKGWALPNQDDDAAIKNPTVSGTAGSSVTYRAVYECPSDLDRYMNQHGVCVSDDGGYIDTRGNHVYSNDLDCWIKNPSTQVYENHCYWNVYVTFHDNAQGIQLDPVYAARSNNGKTLHCHGMSCDAETWCAGTQGDVCTHLYVPEAQDASQSTTTPKRDEYVFRGYFADESEQLIVDSGTTEGEAFSVFYPKSMYSLQPKEMSLLGYNIVVKANPDQVVPNDATYNLDVYGGWARECAEDAHPGTQHPYSHCELYIGDSWHPIGDFGKGDVRYDTYCDEWLSPGSPNSYNPECKEMSGNLRYTYRFVDQYGWEIDNCNLINTCTIRDTDYMVNAAYCDGAGTIRYLRTAADILYRPNNPFMCGSNVLGNNCGNGENGDCVVTGYICRNSCTLGTTVDNGRCVSANLSGGYIGYQGAEWIENIWGFTGSGGLPACNKIQCNTGYGPQLVNGSVQCVLSSVHP